MKKIAFALSLAVISNAKADPGADNQAQVASWLSGNFSSEEQSLSDSEFFNISLKSCSVTVLNSTRSGAFLYVEQAVAQSSSRPYRQRLYRVSSVDASTVESEILLLNDPSKYVGFCELPLSMRTVDESEIENRGCSVFLKAVSPEQFEGSTRPGACASSYNGAVSVDSSVKLNAELLLA